LGQQTIIEKEDLGWKIGNGRTKSAALSWIGQENPVPEEKLRVVEKPTIRRLEKKTCSDKRMEGSLVIAAKTRVDPRPCST